MTTRYWLGKTRSEETKNKIAATKRQRPSEPWNRGKRNVYTSATRRKISDSLRGRTGEHARNWRGGLSRPHCLDCGTQISYGHKRCRLHAYPRGPLARTWKGGVTPLITRIRHCLKMRAWRKAIFERDKHTCVGCGRHGGYVCADHYPKAFAEIFYEHNITTFDDAMTCQELWDIANGRTLCLKCHKETPSYCRKLSTRAPLTEITLAA
jgi:hypothetical protein